jgi:hypothetical protein
VNDELANNMAMDAFHYFVKKLGRKSEFVPDGLLVNLVSIK